MAIPKTHTFYVHGMHCNSCVVLTEDELQKHPKVLSAVSTLKTRSVRICGDFADATPPEIARELTGLLSRHSLSTEREKKKTNWKEFAIAGPIALVFILLFFLLQKIGVVNLVGKSDVTYPVAFIIGIVASLSSCLAVVGGLLLSMSATFARGGDKFRPQILFHVSRLGSFFILGGVIGAVGAASQLGSIATFILGVAIGLIMLILGLNLLDLFNFTKRLQISVPKLMARKALSVAKINHTFTPVLVGIATFFLPCGFTQSMQIYTLSTGNFLAGGLTMLAFALGTLPVLSLISFSSFSVRDSAKAGIFFKSAGLVVILFALFNIINSLVAIGWIAPVFNF